MSMLLLDGRFSRSTVVPNGSDISQLEDLQPVDKITQAEPAFLDWSSGGVTTGFTESKVSLDHNQESYKLWWIDIDKK